MKASATKKIAGDASQATDVVDKLSPTPLSLEPQASAPVPVVQAAAAVQATPSTILDMAVSRGADIGQLTQLLDLKMKWEANEARKAFVEAMTEFKKNPPDIIKNKNVNFDRTNYNHATLATVCDAVIEGLAAVGISHDWKPKQSNGLVGVTCYLTHRLGHKDEGTYIEAPADTSGKKNAIQSVGSSVTYLQRYTLLAACGLATRDQDDDGRAAKDPIPSWVDEYAEAIRAGKDINELVAAWKTAAGACRRKQAKVEYDELKSVLAERCAELNITPEQWAAVVSEKKA